MLQSSEHLHSPLLDFLHYVFTSLSLGRPSTGASTQDVSHLCWIKEKDHLPQSDSNALPNAVQETAAFLFCKCTLLANVQFFNHLEAQDLFLKICIPISHCCSRSFFPSFRTLHFPLLNLTMFLLDHFSRLLKPVYWIHTAFKSFHQHFHWVTSAQISRWRFTHVNSTVLLPTISSMQITLYYSNFQHLSNRSLNPSPSF